MTPENIRLAMEQAAQTRKRVEARDDHHPGLALGISPHGVWTWSLRLRDPTGHSRRFPLGRFPDVSISAARKAARSEQARVETGYDPFPEKAKQEAGAALRAGVGTMRAVIDLYEQPR